MYTRLRTNELESKFLF